MSIKITLEGFTFQADTAEDIREFSGLLAMIRGAAAESFEGEAPEEEPEEEEAAAEWVEWPEAEEEEEAGEEGDPSSDDDEGDQPDSLADMAFAVLKSEARKLGVGSGWFYPPRASELAERAGLSVDQFRSSVNYLKKSGRVESDRDSNSNPKPMRIPGLDEQ